MIAKPKSAILIYTWGKQKTQRDVLRWLTRKILRKGWVCTVSMSPIRRIFSGFRSLTLNETDMYYKYYDKENTHRWAIFLLCVYASAAAIWRNTCLASASWIHNSILKPIIISFKISKTYLCKQPFSQAVPKVRPRSSLLVQLRARSLFT